MTSPVITKGKWKGFPVFGLTLEERATCPRSCEQWLSCYGNGMGQRRAYRYEHGPKLLEALDKELGILSSEPKTRNGFAIRLHTLGASTMLIMSNSGKTSFINIQRFVYSDSPHGIQPKAILGMPLRTSLMNTGIGLQYDLAINQ